MIAYISQFQAKITEFSNLSQLKQTLNNRLLKNKMYPLTVGI